MSADQFDPSWQHDCPPCARRAKELQAADGLRCERCLESFDKPWRMPDSDMPALCSGCARAARAPKTGPGRRYGNQQSRVDAMTPREAK